ncbi:amino acid transporter, transmembrane domain-containing protein [Artemisia annua]|uniref:Amino acid transporter, transmembrane domain-containing protein n=1 Tax=Artemisia annua TaxID=35608 RepID=A0A2U1MZM2_ARTAN|nr:amino acid transporter, transmembrane domain-containing protein [Artemisia annua]
MLPELPNLEVLAASKNPILEMANVEAASILLVGPTLKKFNDIENGKIKGSLTGISIGKVTRTQKIWRISQALGAIAFA